MKEIETSFGKVQIFEGSHQFGSSVLIIRPGKECRKHYHKETKEIEIVLEGEVICNNTLQKEGDLNVWETNQPHGYRNESNSVVKILCITVPPWKESDEIPVE